MKIYLIISVVCVILIIIPFELIMVPERSIKVVDSNGNPIKDAIVRQIWHQYSLEVNGEKDFKTSATGIVNLPKRSVRTNIIKLCRGAINNFRTYFIDAGYVSTEHIGIFANGYQDKWFYNSKNDDGTVGLKRNDISIVALELQKHP